MLSLSAFRWILLVFGIVGLLAATVLFKLLIRRPINAWLRLNERVAGRSNPIPRAIETLIKRDPLLRAWQAFCAIVLIAVWWYLGTAAGAAWWSGLANITR